MNNKFIFVDKNEYEYRNVFSMYNCIRGYENLKSITRNACYTSIIFIIFFLLLSSISYGLLFYPTKKKQPFVLWNMDHIYIQLIMVRSSVFFLTCTLMADVSINLVAVILLDTVSFLASHTHTQVMLRTS